MRKQKLALSGLMLFLALGGLALTSAGCAGTRYHRSTGAYLDDKGITTRVKTALFRDPMVSGFDVHVNTFRGDVQLSGFVDSQQQKERAAEIAREVSGVQAVTNNLEVKPGAMGGAGAVSSSSGGLTQAVPERPAADVQNNLPPATVVPPPAVVPQSVPPPNSQPYTVGNHFEISASNGRAVVRGTVTSQTERQDIERRVREMPGVQTVDDQLRIEVPR
jgi:osmotically-inducible protein OsmY